MKNSIIIGLLFGWTIVCAGCSRDTADEAAAGDAGQPIHFEGTCDATRAALGDPADGKVPVYWRNGDIVHLSCAQAAPAVSRYTLTCADDHSVSASFDTDGSQQWGEGLHDFYAFSPADTPRLEISGDGVLKASLPSVQECRGGAYDPRLLYLAAPLGWFARPRRDRSSCIQRGKLRQPIC